MIIIAFYPLKLGWSTLLSAWLDGSFISILKRCLFSSGPVVAVVMVLLANLVISIEGMQSGRERESGGKRRGEEGGAGVRARGLEPQRLSFYRGGVLGRPLATNNNTS